MFVHTYRGCTDYTQWQATHAKGVSLNQGHHLKIMFLSSKCTFSVSNMAHDLLFFPELIYLLCTSPLNYRRFIVRLSLCFLVNSTIGEVPVSSLPPRELRATMASVRVVASTKRWGSLGDHDLIEISSLSRRGKLGV